MRELQPPLVLFHGYLGSAAVWDGLRVGDRRLITPDLLGHGDNVAREFAPDAIVDDALGTVAPLGEYDLAGYSLGARVVVRMLIRGARPRRAVIGGTGLEQIVHAAGRGRQYAELIRSRPPWLRGDPEQLLRVPETFVDTPIEDFARIDTPCLVVIGDRDERNADALARALGARLEVVAGDHLAAQRSWLPPLLDFLA